MNTHEPTAGISLPRGDTRRDAAFEAMREALREMMRQFEPCDPGADDGVSDCDAIVLARAALALADQTTKENA